jgi:hypothetical protein
MPSVGGGETCMIIDVLTGRYFGKGGENRGNVYFELQADIRKGEFQGVRMGC